MELKNNTPSPKFLIILILFLFLIGLFFRSFLIFFIPGILILFLPAFKEVNLTEMIAYMLGLSISFWIASFWFLLYIPISLTTYFIAIVLITIMILGYFLFKRKPLANISVKSYDFILIVLFLLLAVLRFLPMHYAIAPAGADMSMHTYITELIVNKNGIPENYSPILGIDKFDSFPVGFHTVSALISLLSSIPAYQSTFIVSCLTYILITLFLFVFLKIFVSWKFAFISAVSFTFFTLNPQGFSGWGGTPTIFALAFLILFMSLLYKIKERSNIWLIIFSAFSLAAVLLSHTIIFVQAAYIIGLSFLVHSILEKEYKDYGWIKYALIIVLVGLIAVPYALNIDTHLTTEKTLDWLKNWVRDAGHVWHGTLANSLWTIPQYILNYDFGIFRYVLPLCLIGLAFMFIKKPKLAISLILFLVMCWALILNAKYWILPLSYSIYPERTAVMAIIPISLFFAYFLEIIFEYLKKKELNKKILISIVFILIIGTMSVAVPFNKANYVNGIAIQSSVTSADMKAFEWLKENTNETTVMDNNYGDGGLWIPSIILRPITNAHVNVIYLDKKTSMGNPQYVYIGKKCVYNCPKKASDYMNNTDYKEVYSKEGVEIFKRMR